MARNPKAEVEVTASSKTLGAKLREARAKFGSFGAELKKNVFGKDLMEKGFWGKGGAQLMGNLSTSAVQGGASFLEDQAKAVYSYNDALTRLQLTAEKSPEDMQAYSRVVRKASDETGLGKDKILAAGTAYVALTGDMDTAMSSTRLWAQVAQATNSNIQDISATAAALKQNLKIGPEDGEAAFAALAIQGKKGAIELKDLAAQMSTIAPQWAMFKGGTGLQGLKELGSALQIVKRGFGGDAGETVTGLQSLLTALVKNAKRFQKGGIKIFDVDPKTHAKTMRSVFDIVKDIGDSKLMKDPTKLEKAFGRVEAYRAFLQLQQNKGALDELVKASDDVGVIQRDLATYMQSDAGKLTDAWTKMKNAIADAFTPERIQAFVNAIEALATKIAPVVDAVGAIGDKLGALYGAGQTMRKWLGGDGKRTFESRDIMLTQGGGFEMGRDNGEAARKMRLDGARARLADVGTWNSTVDSIMGGERNGKSTPESIERAIMAVYSARANGKGRSGEMEAGNTYLTNAGVDVNKYVQGQLEGALGTSGMATSKELLKQLDTLSNAIANLANKGTTVEVGGDVLVKAHKQAPVHRTRPGG